MSSWVTYLVKICTYLQIQVWKKDLLSLHLTKISLLTKSLTKIKWYHYFSTKKKVFLRFRYIVECTHLFFKTWYSYKYHVQIPAVPKFQTRVSDNLTKSIFVLKSSHNNCYSRSWRHEERWSSGELNSRGAVEKKRSVMVHVQNGPRIWNMRNVMHYQK